jgi:hypothetical protein
MAQRHVAEGTARIERIKKLITYMEASNSPLLDGAKELLAFMGKVQNTFEDDAARIAGWR